MYVRRFTWETEACHLSMHLRAAAAVVGDGADRQPAVVMCALATILHAAVLRSVSIAWLAYRDCVIRRAIALI